MNELAEVNPSVVQQTLSWVAWLFRVPVESLHYSKRFGPDLQPSAGSPYGIETFDVLNEDVIDMEGFLKRKIVRKEADFTVGDFCELVERLHDVNPQACQRLLRSWKKIMMIDNKPKWRRLLFKTFGF